MTSEEVVASHTAPHNKKSGITPLSRNRDFQALWISRFLAGTGKESTEVAYPLLILAITNSATYAGAAGAVQFVAAMLMSVPGGMLADRFDRRKILIYCDISRAVLAGVFATLVITGHTHILVILALVIASSVCLGIGQPVALAGIKQLVHPSQLSTATAHNQVRFFATTVIGPPVGGSLFAVTRALPFVADAVVHVVSLALLLLIKKPMQATLNSGRRWRGMTDGFRIIARQPILRSMMIWITGCNMAFVHTGAFLAIIATAQSRGASASLTGFTLSLAGFMGLLSAFVAAPLLKRLRPSTIVLAAAWWAPTAGILLAITPGVLPLGIILGFHFALVPTTNALLFGYVAALVPDDLQGRVIGAVLFLGLLAQPIGILGVGVIFDLAGPTWVFGTVAVVAALAALPTLSRHMRNLPNPDQVTSK
ncbi:MFS transporter [Streptomyces sp. NPDC093099]|uniref:MFS transporter n=1 Tax=Streptomyces sp. NPDC093099 TaxID=3366028 RepID=UPI0038069776